MDWLTFRPMGLLGSLVSRCVGDNTNSLLLVLNTRLKSVFFRLRLLALAVALGSGLKAKEEVVDDILLLMLKTC